MKLTFTDDTREVVAVYKKNGDVYHFSLPPEREEDKKLLDKYGGVYEVGRTYTDDCRARIRDDELFIKFLDFKDRYIENVTIDAIIESGLDKSDIMQIKMSIFKKDEVRKCKDKELLTALRKCEDPVDIIMYYGMIKNGTTISRSET